MSELAEKTVNDARSSFRGRWWQLLVGVLCMSMIANLQYGWTLFVNPINERHGWGRAAIQVAFTIFVLTETWLVPIEGYLVDRFGPRIVVVSASVFVGVAWVMNAFADSLDTGITWLLAQANEEDAAITYSRTFWPELGATKGMTWDGVCRVNKFSQPFAKPGIGRQPIDLEVTSATLSRPTAAAA